MRRQAEPPRQPDLAFELELLRLGCVGVAGLDEVGRGAWAGPVVAAAVVLPLENGDLLGLLDGVRDSKQMRPAERARWSERIRQVARSVGLGEVPAEQVDAAGPLAATREAMRLALAALPIAPDHLLVDYLRLPDLPMPQTPITHGDARALSIASASVVAKVARDGAMVAWDAIYPGYGFAQHKGYGTRRHRESLERLGPCPIHRFSYAPVAALGTGPG